MVNKETQLGDIGYSSVVEGENKINLLDIFKNNPIPDDEILANLHLFLTSKNMSRIIFLNHIYKLIVNKPGIVMDFGTRWGSNGSLFSTLRSIYEPFHRHRTIVAFDSFSGFPNISDEDGESVLMKQGNLSVTRNYEDYLNRLFTIKEKLEPLSHIKKFKIIEGDAIKTVPEFLNNAPQTIIALAYFDFDIYEPTKKVLEVIMPYLTKGSVLAFDELNDLDSPGETVALKEVFGLNNIRLERLPYVSRVSYFIMD